MWSITDGTNTWSVIDLHLVKTLDGLNNASVTLVDDIPLDTIVDIMLEDSVVLRGYIKSKTKTHDEEYKYEIVELAIELENQIVTDTDGSYTFIVTDATVNDVVDTILSGSGWTRGSSDTTSLGAVSFTYSRKLPALFKVLKELRGHKVWFDSTTKTVYFGDSRDDEGTLDYFTLSQETSTRNRNIDKVVVFSNDESVYAEYGSGDVVAIYKYTSAKTEEECSLIAQRIYNELSQPYNRIEVETEINPDIDEGDLVTIDSVSYVVYRVEYNLFTMKVHLNENIHSIFDILGSKIIEMTGTMATGGKYVWVNYDGGWQNVDSSHSAKYELVVDDIELVNKAVLTLKTDSYKYFSENPTTQTVFAMPPDTVVKISSERADVIIDEKPQILFDCGFTEPTTLVTFVVNGIAKVADPLAEEATLVFDFNYYTESEDDISSSTANILTRITEVGKPAPESEDFNDMHLREINGRYYIAYRTVENYCQIVEYNSITGEYNTNIIDPSHWGSCAIDVTSDGYIYVCISSEEGLMRSSSPYDISSFTKVADFSVYPNPDAHMIVDLNDRIHLFEQYSYYAGVKYYRYDHNSGTTFKTPLLTTGNTNYVTYRYAVAVCPDDGSLHLVISLRKAEGDIWTNHLLYMRSVDGGNTWTDSQGNEYTLPANPESVESVTLGEVEEWRYKPYNLVAKADGSGNYYVWILGSEHIPGGYNHHFLSRLHSGNWDVWEHIIESASYKRLLNSYVTENSVDALGIYPAGSDTVSKLRFTLTESGDITYTSEILDTYQSIEKMFIDWKSTSTETPYWVYTGEGILSKYGYSFDIPAIRVLVTGGGIESLLSGEKVKTNINISLPVAADLNGSHMRLFCFSADGTPVELSYYAHAIISTSHSHYNDIITEIKTSGTYPSNIGVIVNGTLITTITGDSTASIEETIDITDYLQNGVNTIEITSDTQGSVFLSGKLKVLSFK